MILITAKRWWYLFFFEGNERVKSTFYSHNRCDFSQLIIKNDGEGPWVSDVVYGKCSSKLPELIGKCLSRSMPFVQESTKEISETIAMNYMIVNF